MVIRFHRTGVVHLSVTAYNEAKDATEGAAGETGRTRTREPKGLVMPYLIGVAIIVTLAFLLLETFRLYMVAGIIA
jgi:hypothetical protein